MSVSRKFFLREEMFFQFLAILEISGLGRTLAKQLASLIIKVSGIELVALARHQDGDGVCVARKLHDLRRALATVAHDNRARMVEGDCPRRAHPRLRYGSACGRVRL